MAEPLALSHKHEAIIDFMLLNPKAKMSEVAEKFDMSQSWISVLTNSDLFVNELRRRRGALELIVEERLRSRLEGVAEKGVEAMEAYVTTDNADPRIVHDMTKTALETLGFKSGKGGGGPTVAVQNNYTISPEALEAARRLFQGRVINAPAS